MSPRAKRIGIGLGLLVGAGVVIGAMAISRGFLGERDADASDVLRRPAAAEVRPDYLSDGTPVWVVGHAGGLVSVLSGFDTHLPFGLGKVLWWCPSAAAFENPEHGSKYDEFGARIGGPAPTGLASYEVSVQGGRVLVGSWRPGPAHGAPATGPSEVDRDWCHGLDDGVLFHTFDDWVAWDSPTAAVAAAPEDWILLNGGLVVRGGRVWLCAPAGCADSAVASNVGVPSDEIMELGALMGERFIARVRDGALVDVARVLPLEAAP